MKRCVLSLSLFLVFLVAPALERAPIGPARAGWFDGRTFTITRALVPVLHAQNAAYHQGPMTVTNSAVVQPLTCNDDGSSCGTGTPSWAGDPDVNGCQWTTETAAMRYWYDYTAATNPPTTTSGQLLNGGTSVTLSQRSNCQNFRTIATTGTNATMWGTIVRQ